MNYACVEHEFKTFEFYNWHHVCLTYVHQSIEDGSNVVSMELYVDGTLVQKGKKIHVMLSNCVDIFERMKGLGRLLKAKESFKKYPLYLLSKWSRLSCCQGLQGACYMQFLHAMTNRRVQGPRDCNLARGLVKILTC